MSAIGTPQSPKPPTARVAPLGMSATAVAASGTTLSITPCRLEDPTHRTSRVGVVAAAGAGPHRVIQQPTERRVGFGDAINRGGDRSAVDDVVDWRVRGNAARVTGDPSGEVERADLDARLFDEQAQITQPLHVTDGDGRAVAADRPDARGAGTEVHDQIGAGGR